MTVYFPDDVCYPEKHICNVIKNSVENLARFSGNIDELFIGEKYESEKLKFQKSLDGLFKKKEADYIPDYDEKIIMQYEDHFRGKLRDVLHSTGIITERTTQLEYSSIIFWNNALELYLKIHPDTIVESILKPNSKNNTYIVPLSEYLYEIDRSFFERKILNKTVHWINKKEKPKKFFFGVSRDSTSIKDFSAEQKNYLDEKKFTNAPNNVREWYKEISILFTNKIVCYTKEYNKYGVGN
ncbi:MAG: hypothetical protein ACP5NV_03570 [Candidatus Woesearchaeota archaeon]